MTDGRKTPDNPSSRRTSKHPAPAPGAPATTQSVLELIGRTPLGRLSRMEAAGGAGVWGEAEFINAAGSVKDRPSLYMIEAAEKAGLLSAGATLVEATSGNTGISLAMI